MKLAERIQSLAVVISRQLDAEGMANHLIAVIDPGSSIANIASESPIHDSPLLTSTEVLAENDPDDMEDILAIITRWHAQASYRGPTSVEQILA
jgi:hypothetical protein